MLENSMVLESIAPPSRFDYLRPEREEPCIICKTTACLIPDGWYPDCHIAEDDGVPYLAGEGREMMDASDTPHGWVCSKLCRSQAMYEHASDADKKALRKVMEACRIIEEYGKQALEAVDKGMADSFLTETLTEGASEFLEAIYGTDDQPKWCE